MCVCVCVCVCESRHKEYKGDAYASAPVELLPVTLGVMVVVTDPVATEAVPTKRSMVNDTALFLNII